MVKKLHIKEYINEPIKEPVEIIGSKYYDGSHSFILHSPIFDYYEYVNKLRELLPEYDVSTTGHWDETAVFAPKSDLRYVQQAVNKFNSKYCKHGKYNQEVNEGVEIEVKNTGVLEVPEDKNVDELPIKHFVALANKKGLSTVTKALNNLQVWNKNKDPKLSKWAGDMIDKVTKRVENQKNESLNYMKENVYDSIVNLPEKEFIDKLAFQVSTCYDPTSERMIVHNLEKSRDAAIDCLEFLLPNYEVSNIMDTIHQRSENISTTNDPYEFENYFYDKVMDKTLDYVIENEKVSSRYHISYESVNQPIFRKEAIGKSTYDEGTVEDTYRRKVPTWFTDEDVAALYEHCLDYIEGTYIINITLSNNKLFITYEIEEDSCETTESVADELNQAIKDYIRDSKIK